MIINFHFVTRILSRMLSIIGFFLLFCVGLAYYYNEETRPFILSVAVTAALSLIFFLVSRQKREEVSLKKKDAYFTVTVSWLIIAMIGSLPYLFSQSIPSFTNAFFESMSGFTTTGSSILTDIESLPKSILFWRSLTHWIGGIGIIVLVIVVMPSLQIGGYQLFTMESSLQDKIKPKIKSVGRRLLAIYLLLTFAEVVLLLFGGMNWFESACHAFGTVATGGFSPKNDSIAGYSPYIQYIITLFMLLAGMNFIVHYYVLKRDFKKVKQNEELKFYLFVVALVGLLITAILFFKMHKPLELSFREAFFQVISIITCTGYATSDYLQWPVFGWALIFATMFLGGSTGSTAGGIKMARHLVLVKNIKHTFRQMVSRHAVIPLKLNQHIISKEENNSILGFMFIYFIVFLAGSFLLLFLGIDGKTAASSVATCMAGIGPGIGTVGPASNFAHLPEIAKNILSMLMLLGRLEIYTVIVLFTPHFWKH